MTSSSSRPRDKEASLKAAIDNNQLISTKEMQIRKLMGVIGVFITFLVCFIYPSVLNSYGPLSLALAAFIGVWRTGFQSLWGCVVNLKWNIDGRGIAVPPPEYLEYIKNKRKDFMWLGITTFLGTVVSAIILAHAQSSLSFPVVKSILAWNFGGMAVGTIVSYLA